MGPSDADSRSMSLDELRAIGFVLNQCILSIRRGNRENCESLIPSNSIA
jgi:hypothetical protein